jgi:hypothetical protein
MKISNLINYSTDMCWNCQVTTIVDSWMLGLWPMFLGGADFHTMATKKIDFFWKKLWNFQNHNLMSPSIWGRRDGIHGEPQQQNFKPINC